MVVFNSEGCVLLVDLILSYYSYSLERTYLDCYDSKCYLVW